MSNIHGMGRTEARSALKIPKGLVEPFALHLPGSAAPVQLIRLACSSRTLRQTRKHHTVSIGSQVQMRTDSRGRHEADLLFGVGIASIPSRATLIGRFRTQRWMPDAGIRASALSRRVGASQWTLASMSDRALRQVGQANGTTADVVSW